MASLVYDSKKIIPAPLVTINKVYNSDGEGGKHGVIYELTLTGTLLPYRGSPSGDYTLGDPTNAFWELSAYPPDDIYVDENTSFVRLQRKQEAIRWLFQDDGKILEWYAGAASPIKCRPRIVNISFPEGQWVTQCPYTIELEANELIGLNDEDVFEASGIQDVSEQWQINEIHGHNGVVYEISHVTSAKGVTTYHPDTGAEIRGITNAKLWCDARVAGIPDSDFVQYATGFTNWVNGSYTKSTNIAENDGSYAITETWIIRQAGPGVVATTYTEKSFKVITNTENESIDVTYDGTIYGLREQERTGGPSATSQAKAAVPSNATARTETTTMLSAFLGSYTLPTAPTNKDITVNTKDGIVTFSYQWSAGEEADYTQTNEVTIGYNSTDGINTLTLTTDIEGQGETKEERLTNAKDNIPTDAAAYTLAISLAGTQIPTGVTFTSDHISKTTAINETRGTARVSWTWNDTAANSTVITVDTTYPQDISAKLVIPGRATGPIVQDMNTQTAQIITVSYSSEGHTTKPVSATVVSAMNTAGSILASYLLEGDRETWNSTNGKYNRVRTHVVTEA